MPMPLTIGTSRALLGQADAAAAWLALLKEQATYAWDGVQGLSLAAWVDVVQGVEATAAGTGTTLDTLNGRATAVFNGSGRYVTAAFAAGALTQPVEIVSVSHRTLAPQASFNQYIHEGITLTNRAGLFHGRTNVSPPGALQMVGASVVNYEAAIDVPVVLRAVFNGASSQLFANGVLLKTGNPGNHTMTGLTIAAAVDGSNALTGPIAHVSIFSGARLANAATVAAAAQQYYGIS
jgi:hypothetical protein